MVLSYQITRFSLGSKGEKKKKKNKVKEKDTMYKAENRNNERYKES